jgi:hypothetical protein
MQDEQTKARFMELREMMKGYTASSVLTSSRPYPIVNKSHGPDRRSDLGAGVYGQHRSRLCLNGGPLPQRMEVCHQSPEVRAARCRARVPESVFGLRGGRAAGLTRSEIYAVP